MIQIIAGINKVNPMTQVSEPMFSVVIPTLNRARLLARALKSLISQTENDWEAIIVDDGSTDNTFTYILPFLNSSGHMKYIWKPHSGSALSKNEGIRASTGKFIAFLDSDDEYHPLHLELRKRILEQAPSIRFLYGGVKIIGNPYVPDKNDPSISINLRDCVIGGTFVIEREVLLSLNGFDKIMLGSDADLFERIQKAGILMAEVQEPTYIYHHENTDSVTNRFLLKKAEH
jgi:glycosyltransferase involved in cell wall biosynthesis